jgi:hypothetical protein
MDGRGFSSKAVVTLSVRENISAEAVHATLDRIFEESGCTACGLLGFDLAILTIDDDWSRQFGKVLEVGRAGKLEGVEAISVFGS